MSCYRQVYSEPQMNGVAEKNQSTPYLLVQQILSANNRTDSDDVAVHLGGKTGKVPISKPEGCWIESNPRYQN